MVTNDEILKYFEAKRGCGYRQVGKLYLVGPSTGYVCPSLPLLFSPCTCCGFEPSQYRDFQWIRKSYIRHIGAAPMVDCHPSCPVCYPSSNTQKRYGLMWVGKKFYTPEEFLLEMDLEAGISKAIKQIPKGLVFGETWVAIAHPEAYVDSSDDGYVQDHEDWILTCARLPMDEEKPPEPKPPTYPGIFTAFIPSGVEMLVYKSDADPAYIFELEEKGITVIVVPDEYTGHRRNTRGTKGRRNKA